MTAVSAPTDTRTGVIRRDHGAPTAAPVVTPDDDLITPGSLAVCPWLARYRCRSQSARYDRLTRAIDVVLVLAVSPIALVLVAIAVVAIKVESSDGPILHRQMRTGFRARRFPVLKLRTMVPDAEARKADLAHLNEREWPDFKITDDPRILRCGRFLRQTSIDELPQLWNVLRGDMTLVGPRPTTMPADDYRSWQLARFAVRPGLTGLWQISARHDPSFVQRTRLDLAYVHRRGPLLDLEILARTVLVAVRGEGA